MTPHAADDFDFDKWLVDPGLDPTHFPEDGLRDKAPPNGNDVSGFDSHNLEHPNEVLGWHLETPSIVDERPSQNETSLPEYDLDLNFTANSSVNLGSSFETETSQTPHFSHVQPDHHGESLVIGLQQGHDNTSNAEVTTPSIDTTGLGSIGSYNVPNETGGFHLYQPKLPSPLSVGGSHGGFFDRNVETSNMGLHQVFGNLHTVQTNSIDQVLPIGSNNPFDVPNKFQLSSAQHDDLKLPDELCRSLAKKFCEQRSWVYPQNQPLEIARDLARLYLRERGYGPPTSVPNHQRLANSIQAQKASIPPHFGSDGICWPGNPSMESQQHLATGSEMNGNLTHDLLAQNMPSFPTPVNLNPNFNINNQISAEPRHTNSNINIPPSSNFEKSNFLRRDDSSHFNDSYFSSSYEDLFGGGTVGLGAPSFCEEPVATVAQIPVAKPIEDPFSSTTDIGNSIETSGISSPSVAFSTPLTTPSTPKRPSSKRKANSQGSRQKKISGSPTLRLRSCLNCKSKKKPCKPRAGSKVCESCEELFDRLNYTVNTNSIHFFCRPWDEKISGVRNSIYDAFCIYQRILPKFEPVGNVYSITLAPPIQVINNKVVYPKTPSLLSIEVEEGERQGPLFIVPLVQLQNQAKEAVAEFKKTNGLEDEPIKSECQDIIFIHGPVSKTFRIREETMPSPEELIKFARSDIHINAQVAPEDLECTLDHFLDGYIRRTPHLPMHDLAKNVFEAACLSRYFDNRRPVLFERSQEQLKRNSEASRSSVPGSSDSPYITTAKVDEWRGSSRISEEVRNQFLFCAVTAFEEREKKILAEIDNCMSTGNNRFILLPCMERMVLLYRRIRERYNRFGAGTEDRFKSMETMTNQMKNRVYFISNKSFTNEKIKSAFSSNFEKQHRDAFEQDEDLITRFGKLHLAEQCFEQQCQNNPSDEIIAVIQRQMRDGRTKDRDGNSPNSRKRSNARRSFPELEDLLHFTSLTQDGAQEKDYYNWTLNNSTGPAPAPPAFKVEMRSRTSPASSFCSPPAPFTPGLSEETS